MKKRYYRKKRIQSMKQDGWNKERMQNKWKRLTKERKSFKCKACSKKENNMTKILDVEKR